MNISHRDYYVRANESWSLDFKKVNSNKFITKEDKVFITNQLDLFIGDMKAIKDLIESQTDSHKK